MFQYVQSCFKQYVGFTGRARRAEYWYFVLFNLLVYILLLTFAGLAAAFGSRVGAGLILGLYYIYALGVTLPGLAVAVRRMHDIGKGGGWIFISLVPLIGFIWFLVLACTAGETGENRFGKDPKRTEEEVQEDGTRMC